MERINITKQVNQLSNKDILQIYYLLKGENPKSLLASLSFEIIKDYLNIVVKSKTITLFLAKKNTNIIAYGIVTKNIDSLISEFNNIKYKIIFYLLKKLKIKILIILVISYLKIDNIFLSKKNIELIDTSANLTLLAVDKKYQSKGIGTDFLKKILKKTDSAKYITVEAINSRAYNFYTQKNNFIYVGKKIRLLYNLKVLVKKLTT